MVKRRSPRPAHVRAAILALEEIVPSSGDLQDLLTRFSQTRGRSMTLLSADLDESVSGVLIVTRKADYIALDPRTSPERRYAIVCHEVAHAILGHDHASPLSASLIDSGLLRGIDPDLVRSVVAARTAYTDRTETDAEVVATYLSAELLRRGSCGGYTFYDDRWK